MTLDHLCRNRACVRVDHLELVTNKVNVLRGVGACAVHARKDACPKGHLYDAVYGQRLCTVCKAEYMRKYGSAYRLKNHKKILAREAAYRKRKRMEAN